MWLRVTHGPVVPWAAQVSTAPAGHWPAGAVPQLNGAARLVSQQIVQLRAGLPVHVPFSLTRTPTPFVGIAKAPAPPQRKLVEELVAGFVNVTWACDPMAVGKPPCAHRSAVVPYGTL